MKDREAEGLKTVLRVGRVDPDTVPPAIEAVKLIEVEGTEVRVGKNSEGVGGEVMEEEGRGEALPPPPTPPLLALNRGEGVEVTPREELPPPPPTPAADPVGEGRRLEGETEALEDCE